MLHFSPQLGIFNPLFSECCSKLDGLSKLNVHSQPTFASWTILLLLSILSKLTLQNLLNGQFITFYLILQLKYMCLELQIVFLMFVVDLFQIPNGCHEIDDITTWVHKGRWNFLLISFLNAAHELLWWLGSHELLLGASIYLSLLLTNDI